MDGDDDGDNVYKGYSKKKKHPITIQDWAIVTKSKNTLKGQEIYL